MKDLSSLSDEAKKALSFLSTEPIRRASPDIQEKAVRSQFGDAVAEELLDFVKEAKC